MGRFLGGDSGAFDTLVVRYQDRIYRFASWWIGEDEAADVAQDTFVQAFQSLATWRRQSTFRTWLYGVARNVCRQHIRQKAVLLRFPRDPEGVEGISDDKPGPFELLKDGDENMQLMVYVSQLSPEQRMALMLRAWEGMSYDEIALVMDVPTGTVRSRIHTARRVLAEAIKRDTL